MIEVVSAGGIERAHLGHGLFGVDAFGRPQDDHRHVQAGQHPLACHRKACGARRRQRCRGRRIHHDLASHHRLPVGVLVDPVAVPQQLIDRA
jgi:hypothetical protein